MQLQPEPLPAEPLTLIQEWALVQQDLTNARLHSEIDALITLLEKSVLDIESRYHSND